MSEFSDRPFVAGNVTGLRTFRIDPLGRLTGVTHKDVWVPGENQAVCHKVAYDYFPVTSPPSTQRASGGFIGSILGSTSSDPYGFTYSMRTPREIGPASEQPGHRMAGVKCDCGFYAYFDGGNDYLTAPPTTPYPSPMSSAAYYITTTNSEDKAPRVGAIVNGWGVVTVGTRGFRAEKAQIVALISPKSEQAKHEVAFTKVRRNYPDVQVFSTEVEAVRAFPLTDPHPYSPETDEDFWTRSAS
jgi:hypothetical protein